MTDIASSRSRARGLLSLFYRQDYWFIQHRLNEIPDADERTAVAQAFEELLTPRELKRWREYTGDAGP